MILKLVKFQKSLYHIPNQPDFFILLLPFPEFLFKSFYFIRVYFEETYFYCENSRMDDQESLKLQLAQIKMLAQLEPDNEEYAQLEKDLAELIELSNAATEFKVKIIYSEFFSHSDYLERDFNSDQVLHKKWLIILKSLKLMNL